MIPLILDLSEKRILLFGAGTVGTRKAQHFAGNVRMTIVAQEISPELFSLPNVSLKQTALEDMDQENLSKLIERHDFIIAALPDDAENKKICELAKSFGKWYNSATGSSNFFIPSTVSGEEFLITISTKGASPAVPKYIRERLEDEFAGLDQMILLQKNLRETLKQKIPEQKVRAEILRNILQDEKIWEACAEGVSPSELVEKYL